MKLVVNYKYCWKNLQTFFVENSSEKYTDTKTSEAANLYSIAQTYTDLKMYKNAVKYYKLEISLRDSNKEVSTVIEYRWKDSSKYKTSNTLFSINLIFFTLSINRVNTPKMCVL